MTTAKSKSKSGSWRDMLPIHPACELFPPLSEAELRVIGKDIRQRGLANEIVIFKSEIGPGAFIFSLLDGRSRLDAMELVGIDFEIRHTKDGRNKDHDVWKLVIHEDIPRPLGGSLIRFVGYWDDVDPYQYVVSANLHRRHLDESQRAMVAAKLATLKDGQRQVGQLADVPTQEDAAKLLNVGERSVGRASKVRSKGTPELAQAVEQGRLAVSVAAKAADLPASEQRKLAKRAKKGERVSAKRTDTKGRQQPATKPTVGTTTTVGIAKRLLIYLTAHGLKADPVQVAQMLRESLPGSIDKLDKLVAWLDQFTAELKQQTSKREGVEHA